MLPHPVKLETWRQVEAISLKSGTTEDIRNSFARVTSHHGVPQQLTVTK